MGEEKEVIRFTCGDCKFCGDKCKCIDHNVIHFSRSCFSCDTHTAHHDVCSAFECVEYYPALYNEWKEYTDFFDWHKQYIEQWHFGKAPKTVGLIKPKASVEGREVFDDVWEVPYDDFINGRIMRDDGIHYTKYRHIERTRKNPVGYMWINEDSGILTTEELYGKAKD